MLGTHYEYPVTAKHLFVLQNLNGKKNLEFPTTTINNLVGSKPRWIKIQYESKYRNVNYLLANRMI